MKNLVFLVLIFPLVTVAQNKNNTEENAAAIIKAKSEMQDKYIRLNGVFEDKCSGKPLNEKISGVPNYPDIKSCGGLLNAMNIIRADTSAKDSCDATDVSKAFNEAKAACGKANGKQMCNEKVSKYDDLCTANSKAINEELEKDEDREIGDLQKDFNACPHLAAEISDPESAKEIRKNIKDLEKTCRDQQREAQDNLQKLQKAQEQNPSKSQNAQSQAKTAGAIELQKLEAKINEANAVIDKMQNVDVVAVANMVNDFEGKIDSECGQKLMMAAEESLKKYRASSSRGGSGLYPNYMPKVKAEAMIAYNTCIMVQGNKSAEAKRAANLEMQKMKTMLAAKVQERMQLTQQLNLLSAQMAKDIAQMSTQQQQESQQILIDIQKLQQRAQQDSFKCQSDLKKENDDLLKADVSAEIAAERDNAMRAEVASVLGITGDNDDEDSKKLKIKFGKKAEENFQTYRDKLGDFRTARQNFCRNCSQGPKWAECDDLKFFDSVEVTPTSKSKTEPADKKKDTGSSRAKEG